MKQLIFFSRIAASALLMLLLLAAVDEVRGQSALDGFDPNANDAVNVVVVQPDGKILIGGDFKMLSPNGGPPVTRNHIARLNPGGTLDTAFDPNVNSTNSTVHSIALQPDGKILVGGVFTSIGGQPRRNIARLNSDGTLDADFDPNANGTDSAVYSIAIQADGKILVGGYFTTIGGQARNNIARVDAATGSADSFDANSDNQVNTIALQADGKILASGAFSSIGGQVASKNRPARCQHRIGGCVRPKPGQRSLFNRRAAGWQGFCSWHFQLHRRTVSRIHRPAGWYDRAS
jgi:uncharacterized delta-60 repeat protein